MEAKIYNQKGKEAGTIALPERVFGLPWNADLVHQVIVSMQSNARTNTAHAKGRGEVRGGGKKPWRQKGTGRARHGSRRSPIWKGGGVTHGPSNKRNYDKKVNKKMKTKALVTLLSEKLRKGELLFVDALDFKVPKTKEASSALVALSKVDGFATLNTKKHNNIFLAVPKREAAIAKSFANLPNAEVGEVRNLNPLDLATHRYVVIVEPKESIAFVEGKLGEKKMAKAAGKKARAKKEKTE
ncbi:MAG: 50S ribosomal protein L4 [bacterium]|nr:50S ribosomal protein L4 [bacterium]